MSCFACADIIDCVEFGGIISDVSPANGFFATQDYTFLIDCPPGYICFPGTFPVIITIPKGDIPGVTITPGGTMSLRGCQSMIRVTIPIGASFFQIQALANTLFSQWAFQEAQCRAKMTIPAPTFVGGRHTRTDVTNSEQCFTAHCTPDSAGAPSQQCVEPGQYSVTLFDASPDQIADTQTRLNANALKEATDSATGLLKCGVCNAEQAGSQFCPSNPGLNSHLVIPAGKYCLIGGNQVTQDTKAKADLINGLAALQAGLGCVCTVTVNLPAKTISVTCLTQWRLSDCVASLLPPPNLLSADLGTSPFDPQAAYGGFTPGQRVCFIPTTYTGPIFEFDY